MKYCVGDVVEGVITGIQPYGAFVSLPSKQQGMIHVSEISDQYVKHIEQYFHIGDHVVAKIIDRDKANFRLSLKAHKIQRRTYGGSNTFHRHSVADDLPITCVALKEALPMWIKDAKLQKEEKSHDKI